MHDVTLLINIAMALVVAFIGGLVARRVGLPTIVGYLVAGIAIGPFTPGFVGDTETISQLAELGVIFLLFGVGLHFSFADLWKVRHVAIPGATAQIIIATLLALALTQLWGWTIPAGIVLGLAVSMASTVVLLRGLMDNSLLNTMHGQVAVGWLVLEDLATILMLVLLPALVPTGNGMDWENLGLTLLKTVAFALIMMLAGTRLIPWLLNLIAHTRSRELFILAILSIALGTALGAAELFGVSLAIGAFVAGAVVSESPLSHQVAADALPFREAFAVLFFVSVGMLVNPSYLLQHVDSVLLLLFLILIGKSVVTVALGLLFARNLRTGLVVAAGLSQIGEFSFIVGQAGLSLGILSRDQYSLILAGAVVSIALNPLMFRLVDPLERWLQRIPALRNRLNGGAASWVPSEGTLSEHVVIVGYGRVGEHIVDVMETLNVPHLVIESDVERVDELNRRGTATLFGDAANSEVLTHAGLAKARALVVTVPEEVTSELVVAAGRELAPTLPIIARAATEEGIDRLTELGAGDVIHPELEGGLELVRHTLLRLGFPLSEVSRYTDAVRRDHYNIEVNTQEEHQILRNLLNAAEGIEIIWQQIPEGNSLVGQTLAEANLRARTGASVVAILRDGHLLANPKSATIFQPNDRLGLIGEGEQIEAALQLMR